MLIRFTVENFRSFHQEAVFSMVPGRSKQHPQHLLTGSPASQIDVLRVGLLYGANASGKSNLIKAMHFAQQMIIHSPGPKERLRVQPFKLTATAHKQPSRFEFEFIAQGQAYAYGFVLDSQHIHEEWLYRLKRDSETPLFERTSTATHTEVKFGSARYLSTQDEQFLQFVARSTRPNQLFLSQSIEDNLPDFDPVFNWFRKTLTIIFPASKLRGIQMLIRDDESFRQALSEFLKAMDTGIEAVCLNPVRDIAQIPIPSQVLNELLADLEAETVSVFDLPSGHRYLAQLDEAGQPKIDALGTLHRTETGDEVRFDIFDESDGTQRLVDLFSVLYTPQERVFVVDELERSLHPNLVRRFLAYVLTQTQANQLIVSTHEAALLDLALLRRDEIWFVEKTPAGHSTLYALEEFKPRHDLDIRKGYLLGRFGGVPILPSTLALDSTPDAA